LIDIKDFKFNIVCDFDNRNIARHSIGMVNAPSTLRTNICTQCLIEIITEGLKRLTDEEKSEILKEYLLVVTESEQEKQEEQQIENGQASVGGEPNAETLQEPIGEENKEVIETIADGESEAQKLDKEAEQFSPQMAYRDELITKAKELGVAGKIATFTNKMLENEIEKKLSKLGGK
jgi:uncharacterized protein with ATP-grasp and redox domains